MGHNGKELTLPNPSEMARLELEELEEQAAGLTRICFGGGYFTKSYKEEKLSELRIIERKLGIEGRKYNGG